MSNLPQHIKDKRINHIILPGTHNSGVYTVNYNIHPDIQGALKYLYKLSTFSGLIRQIINNWTINQQYNIYNQLLSGVRQLDLRLAFLDDEFWIAHTFISVKLTDVLEQIVKFMIDYPNEIIIINFSREWENRNTMTKRRSDQALSIIFNRLRGRIAQKPFNNQFPSYQSMLYTNGRIILFYDGEHTPNINVWSYSVNINKYWPNTDVLETQFNDVSKHIQNSSYDNVKYNIADLALTPQTNSIVNGIGKKIIMPWKKSTSLKTYAQSVEDNFDLFIDMNRYNIIKISSISVDFPSKKMISEIINLNYR